MLSLWQVARAAFGEASKLLEVQLRGAGDEGDDATAEPVDAAPVLSQLGIAVRPVVARTLRALGYQDGDDVWVLKLWDKARSPTDLDEGETRLFSAGTITNVVRILSARIVVEAPEIRLGATASKKVNREGDAIIPGTFSVAAVAAVPGPGAVLTFTYTPPGGTAQTLVVALAGAVTATVTPPGSITLGGKTGPGSSKVKAED